MNPAFSPDPASVKSYPEIQMPRPNPVEKV